MKQLTLRGFDPELEERLRVIARERSLSLNRAALVLMRRGAGLESPPEPGRDTSSVGSVLDRFVGVWSAEEEREFLRSLAGLEELDPELWK